MSEVKIPIQALFETAKDFQKASADVGETLNTLEKRIKSIESVWDGAGSQPFFRFYKELSERMKADQLILQKISAELQTIAERYKQVSS